MYGGRVMSVTQYLSTQYSPPSSPPRRSELSATPVCVGGMFVYVHVHVHVHAYVSVSVCVCISILCGHEQCCKGQ